MKKYVFYIVLALIFTSCSKKPEACIEVADENFLFKKVEFTSCSSDSEYSFWLYDDETGDEGDTVKKLFNRTGDHTVTLTCYNKSGRKTDKAEATFYVGVKYIDSLVITDINKNLLLNQVSFAAADLYINYHGNRSNETYYNVTASDLPLTFTFNDARINSLYSYFSLMDDGTTSVTSNTIILYQSLNVHEDYSMPWIYDKGNQFTQNYIKTKTYWSFKN